MATHDELVSYIKDNFGIEPDYPFKEDTAIFRHRGNRKWFAAIIRGLSKSKLGLPSDDVCDIVDLKCDPILSGSFLNQKGVFPGYHMNKEHWVTVVLDGNVEPETLWALVNISYELTAPKTAKKKK